MSSAAAIRALLAVLIYTASRAGAVAALKRAHFYRSGEQYLLHFREKGGKSREIPVRHDLQEIAGAGQGTVREGGAELIPCYRPGERTAVASVLPSIVQRAGAAAVFAADEFFFGTIRNLHALQAVGSEVRR